MTKAELGQTMDSNFVRHSMGILMTVPSYESNEGGIPDSGY